MAPEPVEGWRLPWCWMVMRGGWRLARRCGPDRQTLRDFAKPAKGSGGRSLSESPAEGYLFGALCKAGGTDAALVMPTVSIEAMNKHLAEISQCVSVRAIALLS